MSDPPPAEDVLRQRAVDYWSAKSAQDWRRAYRFLTPKIRAAKSVDDFIEWSDKSEPFVVRSFDIGQAQSEADRGWIRVRYESSLARFPSAASRTTETWQKWLRINGEWYPVPPTEAEAHPDAPAVRNAEQEARLRTRIMAACDARRRQDWHGLYSLCDPRDRARVPEERFISAESLIEFLSCNTDWVEVIGHRGRVRIGYEHRLADPSLSKLPAQTLFVIEPWTLFEDEWYRDLDNPVH